MLAWKNHSNGLVRTSDQMITWAQSKNKTNASQCNSQCGFTQFCVVLDSCIECIVGWMVCRKDIKSHENRYWKMTEYLNTCQSDSRQFLNCCMSTRCETYATKNQWLERVYRTQSQLYQSRFGKRCEKSSVLPWSIEDLQGRLGKSDWKTEFKLQKFEIELFQYENHFSRFWNSCKNAWWSFDHSGVTCWVFFSENNLTRKRLPPGWSCQKSYASLKD